jgi:hypothetical protein
MITGQQSNLASQMAQAIVASIQNTFQRTLDQQEQIGINAMCSGIANALIPFLVNNVQVNVSGDTVNVPATGLTVTVPVDTVPTVFQVDGSATGTISNNGTIA